MYSTAIIHTEAREPESSSVQFVRCEQALALIVDLFYTVKPRQAQAWP